MTVARENLVLAVRNVARWGDTDVLPFPIENHWLLDEEDLVVDLLSELDQDFDEWRAKYPVTSERALAGTGYLGYRAATQIDPIWNAYLLALVVQIGQDIEDTRIETSAQTIFSYRFRPHDSDFTLFDRKIGWGDFQRRALQLSKDYKFVLSTDISDFYSRVYHHRIENALGRATENKEAAGRTKRLLTELSIAGVSYGLPIGGNASRLLAELLLNRTDRLLQSEGIPFCRFVDDYFMFANSEQEARIHLLFLAEILQAHEGLSLQRVKTRLTTTEEFSRVSPLAPRDAAESETESEAHEFLKIRLSYDPYSPTADEDFQELVSELERFDIVGMLARELRKSRVDESLVRQLVKSIRFLDPTPRDAAVKSLVANLEVLYPLFPTVAVVIRRLLGDLSDDLKTSLFATFRRQIFEGAYVFSVPANLAFSLRVLVQDPSEETNPLIARIYSDARLDLLRRDAVLCMARRNVDYWISDVLRRSTTASPWERRAQIAASYILGDEGRHWRGRVKRELHRVDSAFTDWLGRKNSGSSWEIPI